MEYLDAKEIPTSEILRKDIRKLGDIHPVCLELENNSGKIFYVFINKKKQGEDYFDQYGRNWRDYPRVAVIDEDANIMRYTALQIAGFGQYYSFTIMKRFLEDPPMGLSLYGGDPEMVLSGKNVRDMHAFLANYLEFGDCFKPSEFINLRVGMNLWNELQEKWMILTGKSISLSKYDLMELAELKRKIKHAMQERHKR